MLISNGIFHSVLDGRVNSLWFAWVYQVHMELDRKAMPGDANMSSGPHFQERITYKVGSKVIILILRSLFHRYK